MVNGTLSFIHLIICEKLYLKTGITHNFINFGIFIVFSQSWFFKIFKAEIWTFGESAKGFYNLF